MYKLIWCAIVYFTGKMVRKIVSLFADDSAVLKFITIYNKDTDTMEEVLLEELQVFKVFHFYI